MKTLYLDTNIFLYLANKTSLYYKNCLAFIEYCQTNNINLATSVETFQEIIHYSKNVKQLQEGIKTVKIATGLVDTILSIDKSTIEIFLEKAAKYRNVKSRDLIHLSSCIENNIKNIVTYDREFKRFKEVKVKLPEEIAK